MQMQKQCEKVSSDLKGQNTVKANRAARVCQMKTTENPWLKKPWCELEIALLTSLLHLILLILWD